MINENEIIHNLRSRSHHFIGDDAAVLPYLGLSKSVITKDLLVEDVHFRTSYFSPMDLAHKALHVNLSDLAAMGAQPLYILCGIAIPNNLHSYSCDFLNHLTASCHEEGVILIGGDTTSSTDKLSISITAIGLGEILKYRSNAKNDNIICVAGNLGWSNLGFFALENSTAIDAKYISSFLRPKAKTQEGAWLAKETNVTSMMDISDGLYVDLKRLCAASNKGAVIDLDMLSFHLEPDLSLQTLLEGGEDYGLLFTVNKNAFNELFNSFSTTFGYGIKVVGHITDSLSVVFQKKGEFVNLNITPFSHFGEKP